MSINAIATITRREVRDTLSDWRIVVPMLLLTIIVPLLMANASNFAIEFVGDQQITARLVPFVALLVGFIPASFSLVTALESFVGERERNSLESLLAMPVSDRELYLSKLAASLFTPLVASYIAMLVFTFLLYSFYPVLYFSSMTTPRLVALFLSVGFMAITMVTAAVVISIHMSSIRAANLMASFVLLPMSLVVQMKAFLIIWDRWDVLWISTAALAVLTLLLIRVGLISFNREEIISREHQQFFTLPFRMIDQRWLRWLPRFASTSHHQHENPIITIASRELRETLMDWRLLLPVSVLTFGIPLTLVGIADFAVDFVGDALQIARIVPFIMLMMGFIPSSFSLIIALESFVGERERNTLESILSMPISDRDLYISKLSSSLLTPLITSYSAMLTFALMIALTHPALYFFTMTPARLMMILLMIGIMTLLMVAGAVVISSHTGSIRAATLLASFVLIPMSSIILMESVFIIGNRWDMLQILFLGLVVIAIALIRTGLKTFNREEILSREHEQLGIRESFATLSAFFREYQPAGVPLEEYRGDDFSPSRFYRAELPALLHELRVPIAISLFTALIGFAGGIRYGGELNLRGVDALIRQLGHPEPPSLGMVLYIFSNNLRVSLFSNIFSTLSVGLFAFLVPLVAFAQTGYIASLLHQQGGSWLALGQASPLQFLLAYVLPHGIIELPTFILSAAIGIRIGASLLSPIGTFNVGQNMLWALANFLKIWLLLLIPLILLAALVEGLITPQIIAALYH